MPQATTATSTHPKPQPTRHPQAERPAHPADAELSTPLAHAEERNLLITNHHQASTRANCHTASTPANRVSSSTPAHRETAAPPAHREAASKPAHREAASKPAHRSRLTASRSHRALTSLRSLDHLHTRGARHLRARTERGAATAEYAITIVGACAVGGVLVSLLKSSGMLNALKSIINYGLTMAGVEGVHL